MAKLAEFMMRRALRIIQGGTPIYLFSMTAGEILQIAELSGVAHGGHSESTGYQGSEERHQIKEVADYLNDEGEKMLFPNSIIIVLPSTVEWASSRGPNVSDGISTSDTIKIPLTG